QPSKNVKFKRPVGLAWTLLNSGNVAAKGTITYDIILSTTPDLTGALPNPLPLPARNVNIGPGKTARQGTRLVTPDSTTLAAGSYFAIVRLTSSVFTPPNPTDGSIVAVIPFTIS